jgi:hypothetical protein
VKPRPKGGLNCGQAPQETGRDTPGSRPGRKPNRKMALFKVWILLRYQCVWSNRRLMRVRCHKHSFLGSRFCGDILNGKFSGSGHADRWSALLED